MKNHYDEAERAARRLEGVQVVRQVMGADPWLIMRIDGRMCAAPRHATTAKAIIEFVCRQRNILLPFEDTQKIERLAA